MVKRWVQWGVGFGLSLFVVTAFATPKLLRSINGHIELDLPEPSAAARKLHQELRIVDLHADSLLWPRSLLERSSEGHVDLPRLLEGNVTLQVFSAVTKVPKGQNPVRNRGDTDVIHLLAKASGWPRDTWSSTLARATHQSQKLERFAAASEGALVPIRSRADLDVYLASKSTGAVAGLLALEGLHMLEGELARLDTLYEAGYRMGGLTHFFDNSVGGSAHGWHKGGLSEFGREVVLRMEALGMIVDLAHTSPQVIDDVLDLVTRPVVVSHTGVKGTCDSPRNLSDAQIDRIGANGGVIGIGYWPQALCTAHPDGVAKAAAYVAKRIGVQHVALGSDYDGAVRTAFDTSQLVLVTDALLREGFSAEDVRAIMGENALRVLREGLR